MGDPLKLYPQFREVAFQDDRKDTLRWGKVSGEEATEILRKRSFASDYESAKRVLLDYYRKNLQPGFIIRVTRGGFYLEV